MDLRKLKTLIDLVSESNVSELEITEAEGKVRIVKGAPANYQTLAPQVLPAAQPAAAPASRAAGVVRFLKNVGLFFAAPFVGLAYILAFPLVGLGMLAWMAIQAQKKKSEEAAKLQPAAPAKPSVLKTVAMVLGAPFIGLAYVIVGPIVGLGMLLWFGFQAWGKMGAKALAERSETK